MKEAQEHRKAPAHLVFVSSRDHLDPNIMMWERWAENEGILQHLSSMENWAASAMSSNYGNSKLLLMYAIEEVCKQALGPDGE
jgi:quinol monooxygenase YgiN